ncbi:MAG: radical SAM protein [Candidatus Gastranaerophilaceae bacterium]
MIQSGNKMSVDRLKYYRHLAGGALECIQSRLSKKPKPLCFSLMVTSKCNCNCDFCFWKHHKDNEDMSLEEITRLIKEAGEIGYMDSIFWGGEPLLRQDFAEICKASHDAGLYTKIATNGWFLETNPDFAKYTDLAFVSLDAIGKAHDDIRHMPGICDKVMSGIAYHQKHNPKMRIYVCCTVSAATNFSQIKEVAQYCKDEGVLLYFTVNKSNQDFHEWEGCDDPKKLELENDKLAEIFVKIKELKKEGYPIRNSYYFMDYIIAKKNYYECHWPRIATVIYSNGEMLRCYDRKPFISVRNRPLKDVIADPLFVETVNKCKDCKLACVGNYALDASGLWKLEWPAIKSLMQIAIT